MILLTGATGRIAGSAANVLAEAQVPFRAFVRDPEKFALRENAGVEVVVGDLRDKADVERAVAGIGKALLVTANSEGQADIERNFAHLATQAGVQHIVKISSMEAAPSATAAFPKLHYESEEFIKSQGINWTMLRPNFFMQNLLLYAQGIAKANCFALPLGKAKTGLIDASDVGAVSAAVLTDPGHDNRTYELTGGELLDFHEVAAQMSVSIGREIRYVEQSPEEFRAFLAQFVKSQWHLDGVCDLFAEIASHSLEKTTTTVANILGRPPTALQSFVATYAKAFG